MISAIHLGEYDLAQAQLAKASDGCALVRERWVDVTAAIAGADSAGPRWLDEVVVRVLVEQGKSKNYQFKVVLEILHLLIEPVT